MRAVRVVLIVILVGIVAEILYAGWKKGGPNQFEAAFSPGGRISLDLSAGGYYIRGTSENKIRVELDSGEARDVRCHVNVDGTHAKVQLEGPSNNFHATIYIPQRSDLVVDQTIGDLMVSNVEGNKELGLNIGQLQVEVPVNAPLPNFDGSVIIGDISAHNWHVDKGGFFRGFISRSSGPYSIKAHVDIGDLEVIDVNPAASPKAGESHSQKSEDADDDVSDENTKDDAQ